MRFPKTLLRLRCTLIAGAVRGSGDFDSTSGIETTLEACRQLGRAIGGATYQGDQHNDETFVICAEGASNQAIEAMGEVYGIQHGDDGGASVRIVKHIVDDVRKDKGGKKRKGKKKKIPEPAADAHPVVFYHHWMQTAPKPARAAALFRQIRCGRPVELRMACEYGTRALRSCCRSPWDSLRIIEAAADATCDVPAMVAQRQWSGRQEWCRHGDPGHHVAADSLNGSEQVDQFTGESMDPVVPVGRCKIPYRMLALETHFMQEVKRCRAMHAPETGPVRSATGAASSGHGTSGAAAGPATAARTPALAASAASTEPRSAAGREDSVESIQKAMEERQRLGACRELDMQAARLEEMSVWEKFDRLVAWRTSRNAHRDARLMFQAAKEGRPMELAKRLRLGVLAGGHTRRYSVKGDAGEVAQLTALEAARLGGHHECVKVLDFHPGPDWS